MTRFLKDHLTVALDEVDRTASRIVTIYQDLAAVAASTEVADRLERRAAGHRRALRDFNRARTADGQTPEVGDPERAHLHSLWLALKSAVAGDHSEARLTESLARLDAELRRVVAEARSAGPPPAVAEALDRLDAAAGIT